MRVISVNVNGIRSAIRKGFYQWLDMQNADVVCLQETKMQANTMTDLAFFPTQFYHYHADADKKGYSGVAIYTKQKPHQVISKLGWSPADEEGRFIQTDFDNLSIISVYLPSGSSGEERQLVKFDFMEKFMHELKRLLLLKRDIIICGDWNIVHKEIDIKNWKSNQKNSGCLPAEREWLEKVFSEVGWVDAFRVINQEKDQYTWWSNRGQAWAKNVGWRIDYQIVSQSLRDKITAVSIYKEQRFSDHAPLVVDYNY